jgi:hypothetical protein
LQSGGDVAEIEPVARPHLDAKHCEGVFAFADLVGNRILGPASSFLDYRVPVVHREGYVVVEDSQSQGRGIS